MNRGLVIQTAFLGDVILALPIVQTLRKAFPDSRLDFLAIPETSEILSTHPDISQVIIYDKHGKHSSLSTFLDLRAGLRRRGYDTVVCPHRSFRSAMLAGGTHAAVRVGFDRSAHAGSFTNVIPWKFGMHEVERNLSLLTPLEITPQPESPRLFPTDENRGEVERFLSGHGIEGPYPVIAPGTVWETKRYPPDLMMEVARGLLKRFPRVVLAGGRNDAVIAGMFASFGDAVVSAVGAFSFMSSAELIRRASLLVANDSAPIHIASAFNVPTVAIFGPTVEEFGFFPYHRRSAVVEVDAMSCRPCSIHGSRECPIGTFDCMRSIAPERVLTECDRILESTDD